MPQLARQDWYDLARDMNWRLRYVTDQEAFPPDLAGPTDIPTETWWTWDEPYKVSYGEYVRNQAEKDTSVYGVKSAMARSDVERLAASIPALRPHYIVGLAHPSWQGPVGNVLDGMGRELRVPWNQYQFYVAGPPTMVQGTLALLHGQGVAISQITFDGFG